MGSAALPPPERLAPWLAGTLAAGGATYAAAARATRVKGIAEPHVFSRAVGVNRPIEELYDFGRDAANAKRFSTTVGAVDAARLEYEDRPTRLRWRAGPYTVDVRLTEWSPERGVEVRVEVSVDPPAAAGARARGERPARELTEDLRRFKQLVETGEIATSAGPAGRRSPLGRALGRLGLGTPKP